MLGLSHKESLVTELSNDTTQLTHRPTKPELSLHDWYNK